MGNRRHDLTGRYIGERWAWGLKNKSLLLVDAIKGGGGNPMENFDLIEPVLEVNGIRLDARQRLCIDRYAELLLRWNRGINLVGDPERLYSRHFLDCLMLFAAPWPAGARDVLDVGSGAGLPGIVVAVMRPEVRVVSLEITGKKVTFQQVAASALELGNFLPRRQDVHRLTGSAEGRGAYDIVIARAFAGLGELMELAALLLRPGGGLWAMKGRGLAEEQAALPEALRSQFEPSPTEFRYDAPQLGTGGVTAIYRKLS